MSKIKGSEISRVKVHKKLMLNEFKNTYNVFFN